jgi:uncharacterized protein
MTNLSLGVASFFVFYLVFISTVLGYWSYQRTMKKMALNPVRRGRLYLLTIAEVWLRLVVVGIIALLSAVPFSTFGLRVPNYEWLNALDPPWFTSYLVTLFLIVLLGLFVFVGVIAGERSLSNPEQVDRFLRLFMRLKEMLPHTALERRLWLLFSISVGVGEEVLYRGFLPWYFLQLGNILKLQVSFVLALALSTFLFALAHSYQGWRGIVGTGLFGGVCAYLYVISDSLLIPIVFHIVLDARLALLAPTILRLMAQEESLQNQVPFVEEHYG